MSSLFVILTFHDGHLSHNTSYGGTATLQVFCLPQQRYSYSTWSSMMKLPLSVLQSQDLRVGQVKEPCIKLTQENSIENSVQDCPPYILISNGPCKLFLAYLAYPK